MALQQQQSELLRQARKNLNAAWDAEDGALAKAVTDRTDAETASVAYTQAIAAVEAKEGVAKSNALAKAIGSETAAGLATVARANAEFEYNALSQNRGGAAG